jgi:hypothetical protein
MSPMAVSPLVLRRVRHGRGAGRRSSCKVTSCSRGATEQRATWSPRTKSGVRPRGASRPGCTSIRPFVDLRAIDEHFGLRSRSSIERRLEAPSKSRRWGGESAGLPGGHSLSVVNTFAG